MGQEIDKQHFLHADFERFQDRLTEETHTLREWFREGRFSSGPNVGGFELEAWLVDSHCRPTPIGDAFLERIDRHIATSELGRFNIELNGKPQILQSKALRRLHGEIQRHWDESNRIAAELGAGLIAIGILPSVRQEDFSFANMSPLNRYHALNEQTLRLRHGQPLRINIQGRDHLELAYKSVMLEAATTSFQIHLQVKPAEAVRVYNSALLLSAPIVAVSANAPYLFSKDLWDETRLPLFEQAVDARDRSISQPMLARVGFGSGYIRASLMECFEENVSAFPILLPIDLSHDQLPLPHLRLHNGTIWRWNRPLIGFDVTGKPHLRIEHRVVPAGPSIPDMLANAALFFGLARHYSQLDSPPEESIPFNVARDNLYMAARHGLRAHLTWIGGHSVAIAELFQSELLSAAQAGLEALELDRDDINDYLGIIEARLASGRNGTTWQRTWVERHGHDMEALTAAYRERQASGKPVHEWEV